MDALVGARLVLHSGHRGGLTPVEWALVLAVAGGLAAGVYLLLSGED